MLQLLRLDPLDIKAFKAFRIQVKERLYRFNFVGCPVAYVFCLMTSDICTGNPRPVREAGTSR